MVKINNLDPYMINLMQNLYKLLKLLINKFKWKQLVTDVSKWYNSIIKKLKVQHKSCNFS